ncbi:uncharacterized protein LOC141851922 [Brevipalpus obovatus]|uniref:uncharacterized protein LOC141851922 n=1 Tax=Brevipalpus obovatus TaxID=246614 RepID=UPI003D9EE7F9
MVNILNIMDEVRLWRESVKRFLSSFELRAEQNLNKVCDYNIHDDFRRLGLMFHEFSNVKYDLVSRRIMQFLYYGCLLEMVKFLSMALFLDTKTSFYFCDQSALIPQYRWAALIMLAQGEILLGSYVWFMKIGSENPKHLRFLNIYQQERHQNDLKYIDNSRWVSLRRSNNRIYLFCWGFFKTIFPMSTALIMFSPFYFPEARCDIVVWASCFLSILHFNCCFVSLSAFMFMLSSYNLILRYRLDRILRSLKGANWKREHTFFPILTSYLHIYRDFENSRKILCGLMGSTFFCVFGLILNFYFMFLTTINFELIIFSVYVICLLLTVTFFFFLVVQMSSSKGEELCKYITEMMFQTSLRTSTRVYLTELQAMMARRPIAYGCFDIFRLTTMNAFKFYQEAAAWMMLLATSLKRD